MKASRRNVDMQHTDVEFLLSLSEIDEDDLLQFIADHELFIPRARRGEIAEHIIRKTGGAYERAVALLELIVHDQYHTLLREMQAQEHPSSTESW